MQLVTPEIISKRQRETLTMSNIAFMCVVLKKKILPQHFFKGKIKEKIFEFEEELRT